MTRATIWLPVSALRRIVAAAELHGEHETGGMLVGYEGAGRADELVVTELIDAGPQATRDEYAFCADGRWQRSQLARVYEESGRVSTFLGDWHSHPHGLPLPSKVDVKTAARTAANERARAPRPITVIIGRDADDWILGAFRYECTKLMPARVRLFEPESGDLLDALDPAPQRQAVTRTPPRQSTSFVSALPRRRTR